jgi:fibronectin type 3 domain-containing protein
MAKIKKIIGRTAWWGNAPQSTTVFPVGYVLIELNDSLQFVRQKYSNAVNVFANLPDVEMGGGMTPEDREVIDSIPLIQETLSGKQNTLVVGQNIRPINGQSPLGSEPLIIDSGSIPMFAHDGETNDYLQKSNVGIYIGPTEPDFPCIFFETRTITPVIALPVGQDGSNHAVIQFSDGNSYNEGEIPSYIVYRREDSEVDFSVIGSSSTTEYTDSTVSIGSTYHYKVQIQLGLQTSAISNVVSRAIVSGLFGSRVQAPVYARASGGYATANFGTTPQQGNLLVAYAFHRTDVAQQPSMVSAGWTLRDTLHIAAGESTWRRGYAVWTKIAGASEPTQVQTYAGGSDHALVIQEFTGGSFTYLDFVSANNGSTSNGVFIETGNVSVSGTNIFQVALFSIKETGTVTAGVTWGDNFDAPVNRFEASWMGYATAMKTEQTSGNKKASITIDSSGNGGLQLTLLCFNVVAI